MSEPIRIELDGPVPSEPGWYALQQGDSFQWVRIKHTSGELWVHWVNDWSTCRLATVSAIARWSRRLEVHPAPAPAKE